MDVLPGDIYRHVALYLSVTDAFVVAQVNDAWYNELKTCAWLWRRMRIDSGAQLKWLPHHQYNTRSKRKRDVVDMSMLMQIKGACLHKLVLGSISELLQFEMTFLHLAFIASHCPQLVRLDLFVSDLSLTQSSMDNFMRLCPRLTHLTLPTSAFFLPGDMTRDHDTLQTLQLYGNWQKLQPLWPACFGYITTLKLMDVHHINNLSAVLACTTLKHLFVEDCSSNDENMHPQHLEELSGTVLQRLFETLETLHLVRCDTVLCIPFILLTLCHNSWQVLQVFGTDKITLLDTFQHYDWFKGLTCIRCVETRVMKRSFFYAMRCIRCDECRVSAPTVHTVVVY